MICWIAAVWKKFSKCPPLIEKTREKSNKQKHKQSAVYKYLFYNFFFDSKWMASSDKSAIFSYVSRTKQTDYANWLICSLVLDSCDLEIEIQSTEALLLFSIYKFCVQMQFNVLVSKDIFALRYERELHWLILDIRFGFDSYSD